MAAKKDTPMFGAVEERPKRVVPEGFGGSMDAEKRAHLERLFVNFTTFAASNPMRADEQVEVTDLGAWNVASLAVSGNSILTKMRDNGNDPGFYLVATNMQADGTTSNGNPKMVPTKLVIRAGFPHTRERKAASATESS